jgi:hypothetical protein
MSDSRDPTDIPFPDDEPSAREPGSDDDTPLPEGPVGFFELPNDDDIPLPEERFEAEPEMEIEDTRSISQRAAAGRPHRDADPNADYFKGLNPQQRDAVMTTAPARARRGC